MSNGFHSEYYGNDPAMRKTRHCSGCYNEYYKDNMTRCGNEWLCETCLCGIVENEFVEEDCVMY